MKNLLQSSVELEKKKLDAEISNSETERKYNELTEDIKMFSQKKLEIAEKQSNLTTEIKMINDMTDQLKKEVINCYCQIKSNAHTKLRTVDELKLKNINVELEVITNPSQMLTQGMDIDYKIDYSKYDIDMSITGSKELEEKSKSLLKSISEEENPTSRF